MSKSHVKTVDTRPSKTAATTSKSNGKDGTPSAYSVETIKGAVLVRGTKKGIAGLQVFLHENETGDDARIGATITDNDGKFEIRHTSPVRSIEFSMLDAAHSVLRKILSRRKDQINFHLNAEELGQLLPCRDIERKEQEDQLQRETLIRREIKQKRGLKVIENLLRRREFGAKIASQIILSSVPDEVRKEDPSFVEPQTSTKELTEKLLDVGRQGVAAAAKKQRTLKLGAKQIEALGINKKKKGKLSLDDILKVTSRPAEVPIDEAEKDILKMLRDRATGKIPSTSPAVVAPEEAAAAPEAAAPSDSPESAESAETAETAESAETAEGSTEPEVIAPREYVSAEQYVRDAIGDLYKNGNGSGSAGVVRSDQESITSEISSVNIKGGPADVTSYHEFRTVRIAFDPLWSEYFDPKIAKTIEKMLGGLERYKEELPFDEITALEALEPFMEIADELGADLDEPVDLLEPPPAIKTLLPSMYDSTWTALSEGLRIDLEKLAKRFKEINELILLPGSPWVPATKQDYYKKDNPNYSVQCPQTDDFWLVSHSARIAFSDKNWIKPSALNATEVDISPSNPTYKPIYYQQGDGHYLKYVRRTGSKAVKIEGHVYIEVNKALEKVKSQFSSIASSMVQAERDRLAQESASKEDVDERAQNNLETLAGILSDTEEDPSKAYRFKVFAAGSVNFGILMKYQQAWEPQSYQVGNLVSTIPLTPKESRKYKKRLVVKKARNRKEIDNAIQTKSDSSENTGRAESEIVNRAQNATNFEATASGKGGIGVVEFGGSASAKASAQEEKSKNNRKMRQAIQKAAHEYKQERRIEVTTVDSEEMESTESGEITNPNEEITVTYEFYELQKRFLVNERLVDIEPIVLVALDVPLPSQITESWLIRHDWILRRVMLDDSFLPAFKLLAESNKGRDILIGVLRDDLERKAKAFEAIKDQVAANMSVKDTASAALKTAIEQRVKAINAQTTTGEEAGDVALTVFTHGLFGSQGLLGIGGTADDGEGFEKPEAAEARQEATEEMLARTAEEARRLRSLLEAAEVALDRATQKYADAVRARFNKEIAVSRLRNHIAQNILYYMQAIWEYEPPDQRYFRAYDIRVPVIGGEVDVEVDNQNVTLTFSKDGIDMSSPEIKRLADMADLDKLLGFKGNYMMFPLRQHNYLTAWLVQDFLDVNGDVRDPEADQMPGPGESLQSVAGEIMTLETMSVELDKEVELLKEDAGWKAKRAHYEAVKSILNHRIKLEQAKVADVVVPTGMLFVKALTGTHPVIEVFKLKHRKKSLEEKDLQIQKEDAEHRKLQLENIRRTALMLDGTYDDPDIDKSILFSGDDGPSLITDV